MKKILIASVLVLVAILALLLLSNYSGKGNTVGEKLTTMKSNLLEDIGIRESNGDFITKHTVKEGETVESIAKEYELSKDSIIGTNDIQGEEITVGQVLSIPLSMEFSLR